MPDAAITMSKLVFSDLFTFKAGRRNRRSFALLVLTGLAVEAAIAAWIFIPGYLARQRYLEMVASGQPLPDATSVSGLSLAVSLVIGLGRLALLGAAIVAIWAAVAQRAHDLGWSGWSALWLLLPFINLYFLFVFFFRTGQPAENRFGPK